MTIATTFTVEGETFFTREEAETYQLRCERIKEVTRLFEAVPPKAIAYVNRTEVTTTDRQNELAMFFVDNVETYKEAMEVFKS